MMKALVFTSKAPLTHEKGCGSDCLVATPGEYY